MRADVILEGGFNCKGRPAHTTFIRLLAGVNANMHLKVAYVDRSVRTMRAGVQDHALMDLEGDTTNDKDF